MTEYRCWLCRHHIPLTADCAKRELGEDGYLHFPPDPCFEQVLADSNTVDNSRSSDNVAS